MLGICRRRMALFQAARPKGLARLLTKFTGKPTQPVPKEYNSSMITLAIQ